jgi:O-antigen/teichoic acid export membrane protein
MIWAGTVTLALACFFFRKELMLWLYPETATPYYGDVLAFVILTLVPFSGIFIYSTLLTANDSLKKMNWLFVLGIAVNLALNLLLIPRYKAVGAGASAFATQTCVLVGMMFLAKRELRLPFDARHFSKITAYILLVLLADWLLYFHVASSWLLRLGMAIAAGLVLAFLLRLLRIRMMLDLAKG